MASKPPLGQCGPTLAKSADHVTNSECRSDSVMLSGLWGLCFKHTSILAKTSVELKIELSYGYKIGSFYWFKKCTGIFEVFSDFFNTIARQPILVVSEKGLFLRAECFSKSHAVPIYYTKDKMN